MPVVMTQVAWRSFGAAQGRSEDVMKGTHPVVIATNRVEMRPGRDLDFMPRPGPEFELELF
jgi:hypothetical protein